MNAKFNYQSYFLRTALALAERKDEHKENRPSCALNRLFQTIRHLLLLLATAAAALCPGDAWADQISYIDESGTPRTADATQITSETTTIALSGNAAFYVSGNVTINGNLTIAGPPYCFFLILCDGASLTVNGKIISNATFYTYCQSTGSSIGQLNVLSTADDAVTCYFPFFYGGKVTVAGGITSNNPGDIGRTQFTAGKLISVESYTFKAKSASDFICVGVYQIEYVHFSDDFITDDATPLTYEESDRIYDFSSLNGKKLTPKYIFNVTIDPGITGGTVTTDKTKIVENEPFTLTFTPDAGYMLFDVSYNNGYRHINSAELTTARSTGKWTITRYNRNKDCTVTATFAIPAATITSGGTTTYFASLATAYAAVADGETIVILRDDIDESTGSYDFNNVTKNITIDMNGHAAKLCSFTSKYGSLTITDTSTGHNGKAEFVSIENCGDVTIENVAATFGTLSNPAANNDHTLTINGATVVCNGAAGDPPTTSIQWMADHIVLTGGADLTAKNLVFLGGGDGEFTFTIDDNASIAHLVDCKISGYDDTNKAHIVQLRKYVNPNDRSYYDTQTSAYAAVTVDLRQSWGIELKNGLSNATATFYDGGTSFDPTAFSPSAYTTSTLYVDNSNGNDHYVIAHIEPADGYWTDEKLLSHTESGASITGTPVSDLKMVKREQYNGAGWYWYKLPKAYSVAAGYTTSTLGGEVVPQFDLDETKGRVSQSGNVVTVTDGTSDGWKAKLTFDKVSFKFDGNVLTPAITDITILYGTTEKLSADDAAISKHIITDGDETIGRHWIGLHTAINLPGGGMEMLNGWFKSACWDANQAGFDIIVPFSGSGTGVDPWQISTANELNLLAKCVNIGKYDFSGKFLEQKADIGMGSVTDFLPIGCLKTDFKGSYDGKGKTISSLNTVQTTVNYTSDNYGEYMTVGLFGTVGASGVIKDVKLSSCTFSDSKLVEASIPVEAIGAVAGILNSGAEVSGCTVSGCTVSGTSGTTAGSYTGAIFGKLGTATLTKNYYDYTTTATLGSSTASGYTKRGIWDGTKWDDATTNDGAVLWVKKTTISETKPTGSTSSVAFSQKTTPDLADATHPANCYKIGDDGNYYAVNQPITLTVTEGQSKADGLRTFYDGLSGLTVNGSSDGVDLANRSFSMPEADAEIAATFTPSNWFTIPSNGKKWMSFYHVWKDANNAPENYTVSDYNTAGAATPKTIEVKTITAADSKTGEVTFGSLEGVSYSGMPTLFHCETVLPDVLKFTPNTTATTTVTPATQFIGVAEATQLSGDGIYVMNGDGDFIWASDTSEKLGAHKCYVDLGKAAGRRLTVISDDNATGIHSIDNGPSTMDDADGAWYSIDGRKLQVKPTKKGLYIYKGKKTVIK